MEERPRKQDAPDTQEARVPDSPEDPVGRKDNSRVDACAPQKTRELDDQNHQSASDSEFTFSQQALAIKDDRPTKEDRLTPEVTPNKKAEKRRQAKNKIITATLDIIATKGLSSLSHRTIAKAAGVQLAMTTYYFGTLENIIEAAFDAFVVLTQPYREDIGNKIEDIYKKHSADNAGLNNIPAYIEDLADFFTDYIDSAPPSHTYLQAIKCQFLFQLNAAQAMTKKVQVINQTLLDFAELTCLRVGSNAPHIDAHLLIYTVCQLELCNVKSREHTDRNFNRKTIRRLLQGFHLHGPQEPRLQSAQNETACQLAAQ